MKAPFWLVVVLCAGCGILFNGDERRVVGRVQQFGIAVPDTVSVGIPFTVSVTTGGGGCHRIGETLVDIVGNTATIRLYDYDRGSKAICTLILIGFEHIAQVTFDARGAATVVIHGHVVLEYAVWVE